MKEIPKIRRGLRYVKTTVASPNLSPYVERFVRSIKSECMDKMHTFGDKNWTNKIGQITMVCR